MTLTNGAYLKAAADDLGLPPRTLKQVMSALAQAKKRSKGNERTDIALARLMLKAGRLTADARAYVEAYPK